MNNNKKIKKAAGILAIVCAVMFSFGCTDAERSKIASLTNPHHVELYSGGQKVREWVSTGKVSSERSSDGYFFRCYEEGKLIEVSGDVVITRLSDANDASRMVAAFRNEQ